MRTPSEGGIPAAIVRHLRGLRDSISRFFGAIASGASQFWGTLSAVARRRLLAALAVAAVLVAVLALAVPNLPCSFPGGDSCPPPDDASELVPSDALAYLHVNLDPDTAQYEAVSELASRAPLFSGQAADRAAALVPGPDGGAADFDAEIRPWFGGEAAIAVLSSTASSAEFVDMLEIADGEGASGFAASVVGDHARTEDYDGVALTTGAGGITSAQVDGFLLIGSGEGVRAVIDTANGADGTESLADDETAEDVLDQLPDQRLGEAWLSPDGISELIASGRGLLSTMTPLLAPGATRGAAASLRASGDGLELAVRSSLEPDRPESAQGFFEAFPPFDPTLTERLRSDTLAYLGFGDPGRTVASLLEQASRQAPGIVSSFEDLVDSLREQGGVDVQGQLLDQLGDEAAVAVEPTPAPGGEPTTGVAVPTLPYLLFLASGVDEDRARAALAALQGPISEAVSPKAELQAPVFGDQQVGDVDARTLRISPSVELAYAVFDGLVAIATDPAGVAGVAADEGGLDESRLYEDATQGFGDQPSLLAFLDLGELVTIGEQSGLATDPVYATFAGDFRSLDALGLSVTASDDMLSTDARLLLNEGGGATTPPPTD